jgi:hypothetical protein
MREDITDVQYIEKVMPKCEYCDCEAKGIYYDPDWEKRYLCQIHAKERENEMY